VADRAALPDYPYRDDALRLWDALHAWVSEYVGIFYPNPEDISGDYELQGWIGELVSAGHLQDIGEGGPRIASAGYLARLLTQVIFTASVQHAAVNFPQRTIMAFTPAMPLAACAAFPAPPGAPATQVLDVLPPLQMGLLQQLVGTALGGVDHTTLGAYAGELPWFQVNGALTRFQRRLQKIEETIQAENHLGSRTPYTTLLPSLIPQSINI
jgi:arachidonate 15-lipoxygenase